jgi:hypothetical protein
VTALVQSVEAHRILAERGEGDAEADARLRLAEALLTQMTNAEHVDEVLPRVNEPAGS